MRFLILILFIFPSFLWADCLTESKESFIKNVSPNGKVFQVQTHPHLLFYAEDSCGAKGCEIFILSTISPGCISETLNIQGFYIEKTLRASRVDIKVKNKLHTLRFHPIEKKFK